ncbi:MAG: hypothetical protein ACP5O2_01170 [Bacteroidales bacterium]
MQRRGEVFFAKAILLALAGMLLRPAGALSLHALPPFDDTLWIQSDSCKTATPFCGDSVYILYMQQ